MEGNADGVLVGVTDGPLLGLRLGLEEVVGAMLGRNEILGTEVGDFEGEKVGDFEGCNVGS